MCVRESEHGINDQLNRKSMQKSLYTHLGRNRNGLRIFHFRLVRFFPPLLCVRRGVSARTQKHKHIRTHIFIPFILTVAGEVGVNTAHTDLVGIKPLCDAMTSIHI